LSCITAEAQSILRNSSTEAPNIIIIMVLQYRWAQRGISETRLLAPPVYNIKYVKCSNERNSIKQGYVQLK